MSTKFSTSLTPSSFDSVYPQVAQALPDLRINQHEPLRSLTQAGIGGVADMCCQVASLEELLKILEQVQKLPVQYMVVGGASGVLFSDVGYPGLVISNLTNQLIFLEGTSQLLADSGCKNDSIVTQAASRSLGGIEFLAVIPGTIGGAIATDASRGSQRVRDYVRELLIFDRQSAMVRNLSERDLTEEFYRSFAKDQLAPLILRARLQLAMTTQREIQQRLVGLRQYRPFMSQSIIGFPFKQEIDPKIIREHQRQLPKLPGVSWNPRYPNYFFLQSAKTSASQVREYLQIFQQLHAESGILLTPRLKYIGHWPEKEGDAENTSQPYA